MQILHAPAPAKVNLGLHVLRRRADGYHDIETCFLRIGWADQLTIYPSDRLTMETSDAQLPTDERNLCLRAANLLKEVSGTTQGAHIFLEKRIPYGAGLGGGSSDAATTLRLLNEGWGLGYSQTELLQIGRKLGADVSFFLLDQPVAYATGIGDEFHPLPCAVGGILDYPLVVVMPPVEIATAEAYRQIVPFEEREGVLPEIICQTDFARWKQTLVNDFEQVVFQRFPVVQELKELLYARGAVYASMSGSGAAVFGIFTSFEEAEKAGLHLRQAFPRIWWSTRNG